MTLDFKTLASQYVVEFHKEYLLHHPQDWGCCGAAMVCVYFGRKTKVKKELIAAGVVSNDTITLYGKKYNVIRANGVPHVGHQSISYAEKRAYAVRRAFNELHGEGLDVVVHSWVD
ncbi:MAG: hypothetical protein ACRC3J_09280 [Culicoidibacterales bacterium]